MVEVVDGKKLARKKEGGLKRKVEALRRRGVKLKLVSLVMKDDGAGKRYAKLKLEAGQRLGIKLEIKPVEDYRAEKIVELIEGFNRDRQVQGIMIQRPGVSWGKQKGMSREKFEAWWDKLVRTIDEEKDVDGLRPDSKFTMATVKAVRGLLEKEKPERTRVVVVVGSRGLVGRRLVEDLKRKGFKVKGVDVGDELAEATRQAEVLIAATGRPGLIKAGMVRAGAKVIDVGWPKGDVEFEAVKRRVSMITPVPGGVGPLTVVSLLENLVEGSYNTRITHAYRPS